MKLKQTDLFNAAGTEGGGGQAKAQPTMLTADQAQKIANEAAAKAVRDMIQATPQQQTIQKPDKAPVEQTASKAECAAPKNPSSDLGWAWRIASILCLVILILAMIVLGKLAFSEWDSGVKNLSIGNEIPKAGHVEEEVHQAPPNGTPIRKEEGHFVQRKSADGKPKGDPVWVPPGQNPASVMEKGLQVNMKAPVKVSADAARRFLGGQTP